jgi:hypothetical protein
MREPGPVEQGPSPSLGGREAGVKKSRVKGLAWSKVNWRARRPSQAPDAEISHLICTIITSYPHLSAPVVVLAVGSGQQDATVAPSKQTRPATNGRARLQDSSLIDCFLHSTAAKFMSWPAVVCRRETAASAMEPCSEIRPAVRIALRQARSVRFQTSDHGSLRAQRCPHELTWPF